MSLRKETEAEITRWFFDIYFNHWVEVANGVRDEGPEYILNYWGTPMYATVDDPEMSLWLLTDDDIMGFLTLQHDLLKEAGYTHTEVPDRKVRVYNQNGGAIEVIWSRRAADETEIQRFVVHFEVIRIDGHWKVVGVQTRRTDAISDENSIDKAWAQ